ncbi:hypothetical protein BIW11_12132 [Tropilaelaps mercedesae]|uniref:Uncharacterized protein n=1 Tax=Tropilaelaps mercedesae TaxID=418985 RepID=A0A1V9X8D4_9ACAR|nr:hypothetical protein BIW11_12132 [Tropilaelaps mercedesae]
MLLRGLPSAVSAPITENPAVRCLSTSLDIAIGRLMMTMSVKKYRKVLVNAKSSQQQSAPLLAGSFGPEPSPRSCTRFSHALMSTARENRRMKAKKESKLQNGLIPSMGLNKCPPSEVTAILADGKPVTALEAHHALNGGPYS